MYEVFLPLSPQSWNNCRQAIKIGTGGLYSDGMISHNPPFINIMTDDSTVKLFLDAVSQNTEEAWFFVSKTFAGDIDLYKLKDYFQDNGGYKQLVNAGFRHTPPNCKTNSILVLNDDRKIKSIIHLHMVREPDCYGKWKICGIETE